MVLTSTIKQECLYDESGIFRRWLFLWMVPLFRKGNKQDIEFQDLCRCCKEDETAFLSKEIAINWERQLQREHPSLMRAIIATFWRKYALIALAILVNDTVFRLSQPFMIRSIILYFNSNNRNKGWDSTYTAALVSIIGLVVTTMLISWSWHFTFLCAIRIGSNVRTAVTSLIYQKLMRMPVASASGSLGTGMMLSVIANDMQKFDDLSSIQAYLVVAPVMAMIAVYVTYTYLGIACLGGLVILILWIPYQMGIGALFSRFRSSASRATDDRIKLVGEVIGSMKLIKIYAWQESFAAMVRKLRRHEVTQVAKSSALEATNSGLYVVATRLMIFASLITHVLMGGTLTAEMVFVVMSLYNAIRMAVTGNFPRAVKFSAESAIVIQRAQQILLQDDAQARVGGRGDSGKEHQVQLNNLCASWSPSCKGPVLKNITMNIKSGSLCIVTGPVGAGKSCLLNTLIGETEILTPESSLVVSGGCSYSPQQPFCFSGTIRDNIVFGSQFDADKWNRVVKACCLQQDFVALEHGANTVVGEKGVTLSGGQQARVSLARAVYHEADIYLLDDPLSAVDTRVAKQIFESCIRSYLKDKTVILVTHQVQFVEQADQVVVMEDGVVALSGTPHDLKESGKYSSIMTEKAGEEEIDETSTKAVERKPASRMNSIIKSIKSDHGDDENETTSLLQRVEVKKTGSVYSSVYWQYISSGAGIFSISLVIVITLVSQSVLHYTDLWLTDWATASEAAAVAAAQPDRFTDTNSTTDLQQENYNSLRTYSYLTIGILSGALMRTYLLYGLCLLASIRLHDKVWKSVLSTGMSFFDHNPLGRIMNRFSRDIGIVDQMIPFSIVLLNLDVVNAVGIVVVSMYLSYYLILPCIILFSIAIPIRNFYLRTARDLQRLDGISRSPVYSHLMTTADGLTSIRCMGKQDWYQEHFVRTMNDAVAAHWLVICSGKAIGFLLDAIACVYIAFICILLMLLPDDGSVIDDGTAGLLLSSSLLLVGSFQYAVRVSADFENQMVSVERVVEYASLPPEETEEDRRMCVTVPDTWPSKGSLEMTDVSVMYGSSDYALRGINLKITAGEKVGIVGRTGAGKSSLISVLFRLIDFEGEVVIDGYKTKQVSLNVLRSRLAIIPQDPVLFAGSIRSNLDPLGRVSDDCLWQSLQRSRMDQVVSRMGGGLDAHVSESGGNLSVGQRQLLCLARAILTRASILVMDEATANVDQETDRVIQETIRDYFSPRTVLTVAHRLNTVIDYDRILVLDRGTVVEFDHPFLLMQNPDSLFSAMIAQTSPGTAASLLSQAQQSYEQRHRGQRNGDSPPISH